MSTQQLDVYREWLKIPDANRPLDHYQLLRLPRFVDDVGQIRRHFHKMVEHVRAKYAQGDTATRAAELIEELSAAMLVLTDLSSKEAYDASLGRKGAVETRRSDLRQILLAAKVVDDEKLAKAEKYCAVVGVDLHDALIQQKLAPSDVVMQAFADSQGLPFVDLKEMPIDGALVGVLPATLARQHSVMPVLAHEEHVIVASVGLLSPEVEDQLRLRFDKKIRQVICTAAALNDVLSKYYSREAAVAEIAGGGGGGGGSAAAPAARKSSGLDPAERAERKKKRLQVTLVAFAMSVTAIMMIASLTGWSNTSYVIPLITALTVGAVAAGIAWLVGG